MYSTSNKIFVKFGIGVILKGCRASVSFVKIGSVTVMPYCRAQTDLYPFFPYNNMGTWVMFGVGNLDIMMWKLMHRKPCCTQGTVFQHFVHFLSDLKKKIAIRDAHKNLMCRDLQIGAVEDIRYLMFVLD